MVKKKKKGVSLKGTLLDGKPCLKHNLFQGPDLEVLRDVSTVEELVLLYVCEQDKIYLQSKIH